MEDFSNILWVVIILGAMIFNSVSKARKAKNRSQDPAPQPHDEAWPSIPLDDETVPQKPSSADSIPVPRQTSAPQSRPEPRMTGPQTRSKSTSTENVTTKSQIPLESTSNELFPDECQSLEVIPSEEFASDFEEPETAFSDFPELSTAASSKFGRQKGKSTPREERKVNSTPENALRTSRNDQDSEKSLAEVVDEFDLRRAVIYSEILKPKFEEE